MKQNPTIAPASSNVARTAPGKFPYFALTCVVLLIGIGTLIFLANWNKLAGPGNRSVTAGPGKAPSPDQLVETTGTAAGPLATTQLVVPRRPHASGTGSDAQPSAEMR